MIPRVVLLLSLVATALAFPYSLHAQEAAASPPDLNLILDSLERTQEQNPALSQPYEVTRDYQLFRGDDPMPASVVTAQIGFTPPDTKTFQIIKAEGSPRGKKIVSEVLKEEIAAAKTGPKSDISRSNYDFTFVREENFGAVPEYVLHMVPKRKEKGLLLGDIWVDAKTYRIRQIIGVPVKGPSFWITNLSITVQFAAVNGLWIPVSWNATATLRLLGLYTLSGLEVATTTADSNGPNVLQIGTADLDRGAFFLLRR